MPFVLFGLEWLGYLTVFPFHSPWEYIPALPTSACIVLLSVLSEVMPSIQFIHLFLCPQMPLRLLRMSRHWVLPCDRLLPICPYDMSYHTDCRTYTSDLLSLSRTASSVTPDSSICLLAIAIHFPSFLWKLFPDLIGMSFWLNSSETLPYDNVLLHYHLTVLRSHPPP